MKKYHSQRGAILVESALVVGAIFLMLFGTVYLAIIGFDQMSADGASYQVAHQTAVGASAPPSATHGFFPNIPQAQITTVPLAAPSAQVPVDYGYNDSNATAAADSVDNRHGGVSMVQAEQIQGVASKTSAKILGQPIGVLGNMIEPLWVENGLHFNAENSDSYGGTSPVCAATATPAGGGAATPSPCFQGNPLTQGENAPPYFVGFNLMAHCQDYLPYGDQANYACQATEYTPLGVSEFLDYNNWCSSPAGSSSCNIPAGAAGSAQTDGTFATASCHQRVYVTIAKFFQANTTLATIYQSQNGLNGAGIAPYLYYGYRNNAWRKRLNNPQIGPNSPDLDTNSFQAFTGFDSTLAAQIAYNEQGIASTLGPVDTAVQEVYHWDGLDVQGTPPPGSPNDPLAPGNGC